MVICLERGADLHMAQLMPLPLTVSCFSKIQIVHVVPFWYRLTRVVLDKGPLNGCVLSSVYILNEDITRPRPVTIETYKSYRTTDSEATVIM